MRNSAKIVKRLVVRYPEVELQELKGFLQQFGAKQSLHKATGVCYATMNRIADTGKGSVEVVVKIRDYMKSLKKEGII